MTRLEQIRKRHKAYKKQFEPPYYWKSTLDIGEVDFLLRKIERLKAKVSAKKR